MVFEGVWRKEGKHRTDYVEVELTGYLQGDNAFLISPQCL